jgi:hypothetical protein
MHVEISPRLYPRRGGEVKVGNVYDTKGQKYCRLVVSIVVRQGNRPWNNIICLHIDNRGDIVGSSAAPELYVKEHQDLVGIVREMPALKIEWLKGED